MLSEPQKNKFTAKAKEVAKELLDELDIQSLNDENIGDLLEKLDLRVASLVSAQEDGEYIDEELLEIYDLLTDIVLDHEEDLEFLNQLFD